MGFTGPRWCGCVRVGDVPAAVSSLVALSIVVDGLRPSTFGCDRSNRSGLGCFVAVGLEDSGLKRSTKPKAVVEGWRSVATGDELKLRAFRVGCQAD
jgi:hypothetical protein